MSDLLQNLKIGLAVELEKQGSSLIEFETKLAELEKTGATDPLSFLMSAGGGLAKGIGGLLSSIPEIALTGSLMAGTAAGSIAYGAHSHIKNQDKKLKEKELELDRIKELTHRLKSDYGIS